MNDIIQEYNNLKYLLIILFDDVLFAIYYISCFL